MPNWTNLRLKPTLCWITCKSSGFPSSGHSRQALSFMRSARERSKEPSQSFSRLTPPMIMPPPSGLGNTWENSLGPKSEGCDHIYILVIGDFGSDISIVWPWFGAVRSSISGTRSQFPLYLDFLHTFFGYTSSSLTPPKCLAPRPVQLNTAVALGKSEISSFRCP
jgi:hypothetical protein